MDYRTWRAQLDRSKKIDTSGKREHEASCWGDYKSLAMCISHNRFDPFTGGHGHNASGVELNFPCPCGGPPNHVPNGIHCRKGT